MKFPPACGKTFISKQLVKNLQAGDEEINRSSDFFEENIRDYEYEVIEKLKDGQGLMLFYNSSEDEFNQSMKTILAKLEA